MLERKKAALDGAAQGKTSADDEPTSCSKNEQHTLTVLTCKPGATLAKTWRADGTIDPCGRAAWFQAESREAPTLEALHDLLAELAGRPDAAVIRGRRNDTPGGEGGWVRRKTAHFDDVPRAWVCLDLDSWHPEGEPHDWWRADPGAAFRRWVAEELPPEFAGVGFVWGLSASAGHPSKPGLRGHTWFLLSEPRTATELRAWAKAVQLRADHATLRQVQLIYTSDPLRERGAPPRPRNRLGLVRGDRERVSLDMAPVQPAAAPELPATVPDDWTLSRPPLGLSEQELRQVLQALLDAGHLDHREGWVEAGMALHAEFQGAGRGFELWLGYSALARNFKGQADLEAVWKSFQTDRLAGITLRTLLHRVKALGVTQGGPVEALPEPELLPFPPPFPGPMADTVAAALAVAPRPQRGLTTLAVLIGMAAGVRGTIRLPSGGRLNLYGLGVAGTATGKDLPRRVAMELAAATGCALLGKPASGQGLEDALKPYAHTLVAIDEAGHLWAAINGARRASHEIELVGNLLKLFSAGAGTYVSRVRAGEPPKVIRHPAVSLLGFSTPEVLGESLGLGSVEDGLLGRMLFALASDVPPRRVRAEFALPDSVRDIANRLNPARGEVAADEVITLGVEPDADARLEALMRELDRERAGSGSVFAQGLWGRSLEKLERVAAVMATWDCPEAPTIRLEHVTWAERVIRASNAAALHFAEGYLHGSAVQGYAAKIKRAAGAIRAGVVRARRPGEQGVLDEGLVPYSLVLRASKLDADAFAAGLKHMAALGEVAERQSGRARVLDFG